MILSLYLDSVKAKGLCLNSQVIEKTQRLQRALAKLSNIVMVYEFDEVVNGFPNRKIHQMK